MSDEERPFPTPRYSRMLAASIKLAQEMHHSYVGVEHLFLAIIRDRDAVPTQALARLTDLDAVDAGVREVMAESSAGKMPPGAVWLQPSELPGLLPALARCIDPGSRYGFNVAGDRAWIFVEEPGDTAAAVAAARALIEGETD